MGFAQGRILEIVNLDTDRFTLRVPLSTPVRELADELFLLGIHRDHRQAGVAELTRALIEIAKLRIPVFVLASYLRLGMA
jgi:hypothetical protein